MEGGEEGVNINVERDREGMGAIFTHLESTQLWAEGFGDNELN